jgi:hypothetical protein
MKKNLEICKFIVKDYVFPGNALTINLPIVQPEYVRLQGIHINAQIDNSIRVIITHFAYDLYSYG